MRFSIRKSGRLAAMGQQRATIEEALELALERLGQAQAGEVVTLEDHETGKTYKGDDISRLATAIRNDNA